MIEAQTSWDRDGKRERWLQQRAQLLTRSIVFAMKCQHTQFGLYSTWNSDGPCTCRPQRLENTTKDIIELIMAITGFHCLFSPLVALIFRCVKGPLRWRFNDLRFLARLSLCPFVQHPRKFDILQIFLLLCLRLRQFYA
jgi:hypothetical protein